MCSPISRKRQLGRLQFKENRERGANWKSNNTDRVEKEKKKKKKENRKRGGAHSLYELGYGR